MLQIHSNIVMSVIRDVVVVIKIVSNCSKTGFFLR